jgi:putative transposase
VPLDRRRMSGNRRGANCIVGIPRSGAPCLDMPARYRNWNSVFVRLTRWSKQRTLDAEFEALASLGRPTDEEDAVDSTIV